MVWVLILVGVIIRLGTTGLQPMQPSQSPSLPLFLQLVTGRLFSFSLPEWEVYLIVVPLAQELRVPTPRYCAPLSELVCLRRCLLEIWCRQRYLQPLPPLPLCVIRPLKILQISGPPTSTHVTKRQTLRRRMTGRSNIRGRYTRTQEIEGSAKYRSERIKDRTS